MNIYTPEGWLDARHIDEIATRNNISFIVVIGKRQIGKTYNVLKLLLDEERDFIYMRRVTTELDMLKKNVNSPFDAIHGYENRIRFEPEGKYTASIVRLDQSEEGDIKKRIGLAAALATIGNIRGFHSTATDLVIDEFIPEEHLFKVREEDSVFLNAHVTISGNRELEGKPPLRTWLLANSNNLNSKILDALKITRDVERMSLRGEETKILKERGIMILLPESTVIIDKRKKTALYKAIGGDSKFSRMAYNNEFAYNDYTDVSPRPLAEYNPLVSIGRITIHLHKNDKTLYVTDRVKQKARYDYTDSDTHVNMFNRKFGDIRAAYLKGRITFMDMRVKNYFLDIVDM